MAKLELQTRNFRQFDNVGDSVQGVINGFFTVPTRFGTQQCISMVDSNGEEFCIGCTANLVLYLPQLHQGMNISVTWVSNEKNPTTKNTYRVFEIDVIEDRSLGHEVNLDDDIPF